MTSSPRPVSALRVLVVEDESEISRPLQRALEREGYRVSISETGEAALDTLKIWGPDVILLDLHLPDMDGMDVARSVRQRSMVPIVMVTARGEEEDRIAGLEAGADDYVVKPFSMAELIARIRSAARRANALPPPEEPLRFGSIELQPESLSVIVNGGPVRLSAKEFELLRVLVAGQGGLVRREDLVRAVWSLPLSEAGNTLDVHISWLRRKLGDDTKAPRYIETIRGIGFRLLAP